MNLSKVTPAQAVVAYFACFALAWVLLAILLSGANGPDVASVSHRGSSVAVNTIGLVAALAIHAALVAVLAWKARRWFFAHGMVAVVVSGLPLLALLRQLWFVPAFLYLIAVLHIWLASRRDAPGQLQTTQRHSTGTRSA